MKKAASLAEHILHTRHDSVAGGVHLTPSSGGVFEITLNDTLIYSKKTEGRFPEQSEVDQLLDQHLG